MLACMRRGPDLDVTRYLSYRKYLDDWFQAQKQADRRYSHRLFARRAEVKSPSLLKEVVAGRRNLTPTTVEGFLLALRLEGEDADFFRALVQLDQAETHQDKNRAWERVASCRRFRDARSREVDFVRYLSSWHYVAIRELALCGDFDPSPEAIAARLHPNIPVKQAADAIALLLELGLLVQHADGSITAADTTVATPHEVAWMTASNYHREMLARAADSLENVPAERRHLCALTVAVPASLVPKLKAEMDAFQERLLHLCDDSAASPEGPAADQVYQLNLQLVPLSRGPA
jgi:uncharacterized protein (TIGR02147 family)